MAVLNAAARRSIPKSQMGLPGKSKPGKGASTGTYPMPDKAHAANAKAMAARFASPAQKATIDAKANKMLGLKNAIAKKKLG